MIAATPIAPVLTGAAAPVKEEIGLPVGGAPPDVGVGGLGAPGTPVDGTPPVGNGGLEDGGAGMVPWLAPVPGGAVPGGGADPGGGGFAGTAVTVTVCVSVVVGTAGQIGEQVGHADSPPGALGALGKRAEMGTTLGAACTWPSLACWIGAPVAIGAGGWGAAAVMAVPAPAAVAAVAAAAAGAVAAGTVTEPPASKSAAMMLRPWLITDPMSLWIDSGSLVSQSGGALAVTRFSTKAIEFDERASCTLDGTAVCSTDSTLLTSGSATKEVIYSTTSSAALMGLAANSSRGSTMSVGMVASQAAGVAAPIICSATAFGFFFASAETSGGRAA